MAASRRGSRVALSGPLLPLALRARFKTLLKDTVSETESERYAAHVSY
jgi:hypothetical protein